jgi:hypothetical protein
LLTDGRKRRHPANTVETEAINPTSEITIPERPLIRNSVIQSHRPHLRGIYARKSGKLHSNLDKTWTIILSLPVGQARTNLELIHQSNAQLGLSMRKTLMEMV